jgi:hypothetical protein
MIKEWNISKIYTFECVDCEYLFSHQCTREKETVDCYNYKRNPK